jgi:hypothetical protein
MRRGRGDGDGNGGEVGRKAREVLHDGRYKKKAMELSCLLQWHGGGGGSGGGKTPVQRAAGAIESVMRERKEESV